MRCINKVCHCVLCRPLFKEKRIGGTVLSLSGGLEDIGLELADWLVSRGARKLVLTSRDGIKTGYQSLRVRIWRSYGTTVVISPGDITTKSGVRALLSHANKLGQVDAIFNLAVVRVKLVHVCKLPGLWKMK